MTSRSRTMRKPPRPIAWPAVIDGLLECGVSGSAIQKYLGISRARLWYWRQGKHEPNYRHGELLLLLWGTHVPKAPPREASDVSTLDMAYLRMTGP